MFDLEKALSTWRRFHARRRRFLDEDLDELEVHLRAHIAELREEGWSEEAAFREAVQALGDLVEAEEEYGKVYWGKVQRKHRLLHELTWKGSMLKNYVKIAFRTLSRQKGYAFINIFGLAVGLACFILILLFVQHELSYDRFHEKADRIYRVVQRQPGNLYLSTDRFAVTPAALASALIEELPEVTEATAIMKREALLSFGTQNYWEDGLWADTHFFDVFTFPLLRGNPETALAEPSSIVLTESLAWKIFGAEDPMGQTVLYQNQDAYTVTGVMPDVPVNSSLKFAFITDFPLSEISYENVWRSNNTHTFFRLTDGTDEAQFQAKLPALVDEYLYAGTENVAEANRTQYLIQPLTDVHLRSQPLNFDIASTGDITYVYLFLAIGFMILLLACVNYTNLAVARSIKRAREVGLRKVVGARRPQLIR